MIKDISGQKFGRLSVLNFEFTKNTNAYWKCICECGSIKVVAGCQLRSGKTKSCGCYLKDIMSVTKLKHGKCIGKNHKIYGTWLRMHHRCKNKNNKSYKDYGGRGISVCKDWNIFENFLRDMGEPDDWLSLERIDVNGNYCKENCKWATKKEQANNKRSNRIVCINKEKMNIAQASEKFNIPYKLLWSRLKRGWNIYKALGIENNEVS